MATIESELVLEPALPVVRSDPEANFTVKPAFEDAEQVIAAVRAVMVEEITMALGYVEMAAELTDWSETSFAAQAEVLPEE